MSINHLENARAAVDQIAALAVDAAHPGMSAVTVHAHLAIIAHRAAEVRAYLAQLDDSP